MSISIPYRKNVIKPFECYQEAWLLVKDQYWLFVGIILIGLLIGSAVPLGILLGPMMCGIYLALLNKSQGQKISFELLFKGFDFFIPSLIATLVQVIPVFLVLLPLNFIFLFQFSSQLGKIQQNNPAAANEVMGGLLFSFLPFVFIMILLTFALSAFFLFTYPLIVEKKLSGWDAIKTSAKAGWENIGGILGLVFLNMFLGLIGVCVCYVGVFLITPISFGAIFKAYQKVFSQNEIISA